jgi:predicted transcriptional regulator
MRQNIIVTLDKHLLSRLRVIAAVRETSFSGLLRTGLTRIVERHDQFEAAKRRVLADMDQGFDLGGRLAPRDELRDGEALRGYECPAVRL